MAEESTKQRYIFFWPERKARLLTCAVCRGALPVLNFPALEVLIEAVEMYTDGTLTVQELRAVRERVRAAASELEEPDPNRSGLIASILEVAVVHEPLRVRAEMKANGSTDFINIITNVFGFSELMRCAGTEGPPAVDYNTLFDDLELRPFDLAPRWRTATVTALAKYIYDKMDWCAMPLLADALEDAGCDHNELLDHCRGNGPHYRGCWAIDSVLERGSHVNETGWDTCADPWAMLEMLRGRVSERKLRLLMVAWCRWHGEAAVGPRNWAASAVAERYADGAAGASELEHPRSEIEGLDLTNYGERAEESKRPLATSAYYTCCSIPEETIRRFLDHCAPYGMPEPEARGVLALHAAHIRCLFGSPFHATCFSPEWRSENAVRLASQMYESRNFSAMPLLADALQNAGCDSEDVLNHCYDRRLSHARGCWVIDGVLGKS